MRRGVGATILILASVAAPDAIAQSAAEILEQARSRGREFEELKVVLNGPDANMRLATFEAMSQAEDEAIRAVALDVGLASADIVLQELAFKHAIMALDRLHLSLTADPEQTKEMLALTNDYLAANGNSMTLTMGWKDPEKGRFQVNKSSAQYAGEVSGSLLTFKYYKQEGTLRLVDESAIEGAVTDQHKKKRIRMIGRMEFR
jgi:hypothetical protein